MKESKDTENRIYKILTSLLDDKVLYTNIDINLDLNKIPVADSLFFIHLVAAIEDEFKFKFDLEDLVGVKKASDFVNLLSVIPPKINTQ
jgi:acyl carrier protein